MRLCRRAQAASVDHLARRRPEETGVIAGADGLAVEMDRCRRRIGQAAAEMRIVQSEIVAQRIEQRHVRIGIDRMGLAVHVELEFLVHAASPPEEKCRP